MTTQSPPLSNDVVDALAAATAYFQTWGEVGDKAGKIPFKAHDHIAAIGVFLQAQLGPETGHDVQEKIRKLREAYRNAQHIR